MKLLVNQQKQLNIKGIVTLSLIVSFLLAFLSKGSLLLSNTIQIQVFPIITIVYSLSVIMTLLDSLLRLLRTIQKTVREILLSQYKTFYQFVYINIYKELKNIILNSQNTYQTLNVIRC